MGWEDRDDGAGHLVLDREDILELPIVALGPAMCAGQGIDELHRDTNPITTAANASFQDVTHAEFSAHLPHVDRLALVLEGGVAGDDKELRKPRQLRNDVFDDTIREILLLGIAAHV